MMREPLSDLVGSFLTSSLTLWTEWYQRRSLNRAMKQLIPAQLSQCPYPGWCLA